MRTTILLFVVIVSIQCRQKCVSDEDCEFQWPGAICIRSRCRCPENTVYKKSDSRGWVCLSVIDAATGESGPPLTCPLPEGAGYQMIGRNESSIFTCASRMKNECPEGFECIQGLTRFNPKDGVCCPNKASTCDQPIFDHDDGILERWGFNVSSGDCQKFKWNPDRPSTANTFSTKQHCDSYCVY